MKRVDRWTEPSPTQGQATDMTPAPGAPRARARIVATIIDPSVREDGLGDPVVLTAGERARRGSGDGGAPERPERLSRGHAVRERLMAKARAVTEARTPPSSEEAFASADTPERSAPEEGDSPPAPAAAEGAARVEPDADAADVLRFEALPELGDDLDLIGTPEPPREPPRAAPPPTSAPAALLLGTLLGVTALAVTFSALIQLAPHEPLLGRAPPLAALAPAGAQGPASAEIPQGTVVRAPRRRVPGPWRISDAAGDPEASTLSGKIGNNTFLSAIQAAGINLRDGYRVLKAFEGVKDLNHARPRDAFTALVQRSSGRVLAFEYAVSGEEVYQAREGPDGLLFGQKLDLQIRRERVSGVVIVSGGFDAAAERAGFEPGLGAVVNKALAGYSSVGEMRDGDVVAVVAQEVTVLGEFSRYAGVEALEYRPLGSEPVRLYYHAAEKTRGYVDSKGRVFGKSRWARPVPGAAITSRFNPKRLHPILKVVKPHNGTDFGAPTGTPVVASAFGKVTFIGEAGPNGNMITLSHEGGYETGYSHLSRFAKGLKVGDRVAQKQVIGYVGSTGRSTGPHLHFSAKRERRFIDPESLNLDAFSRLVVADRQVLSQLQQRYDRLLAALPIPEPKAPAVALASAAEAAGEGQSPVADTAPSLSALALMPAPGTAPPAETAAPAAAPSAPPPRAAGALHAASAPQNALAVGAPSPPLSIYLTDRELIARQPAVHDGEVDP